jgi:GT2 family glycosyltransferase
MTSPVIHQSPIAWTDLRRPVVSIIILTFNQVEYTRMCVESALRHSTLPFELIFVDNASNDGTLDYLRTLPNVRIVANAENLGYAAGNNQGLALARGEYALLLNNDAIATPGWLERMVAPMQRDSRIGLVGPRSNYVAGPQLVERVPYESMEDLDGFAAERARVYANTGDFATWIVGFCMLVRMSVVERIGGLDPVFGSGNFEDTDFCLRAMLAGWVGWIANDVFVHHYGHVTFIGAGIDWVESMKRNGRIFAGKWNVPLEGDYVASFDVLEVLRRYSFNVERDYCALPTDLTYVCVTAPLAAYYRGVQRLQAGDPRGALLALQEAVDGAPEVADFHNALGAAYCEAGMLYDAVASLSRAAELSPESESIRANLVEARQLAAEAAAA